MTEIEHFMTCGAEEAVEVAQRFTKALRFGLTEVQPGQDLDNLARIGGEVEDLLCVIYALRRRGVDIPVLVTPEKVSAKEAKIVKLMVLRPQPPAARFETRGGRLSTGQTWRWIKSFWRSARPAIAKREGVLS